MRNCFLLIIQECEVFGIQNCFTGFFFKNSCKYIVSKTYPLKSQKRDNSPQQKKILCNLIVLLEFYYLKRKQKFRKFYLCSTFYFFIEPHMIIFSFRKQQFCWHIKLQFPQSQAVYIEKRYSITLSIMNLVVFIMSVYLK